MTRGPIRPWDIGRRRTVFPEGQVPQNEESTVGRWSPEADVVCYAGAAGPSLNSALILSN